jgi:hypothetical protein
MQLKKKTKGMKMKKKLGIWIQIVKLSSLSSSQNLIILSGWKVKYPTFMS